MNKEFVDYEVRVQDIKDKLNSYLEEQNIIDRLNKLKDHIYNSQDSGWKVEYEVETETTVNESIKSLKDSYKSEELTAHFNYYVKTKKRLFRKQRNILFVGLRITELELTPLFSYIYDKTKYGSDHGFEMSLSEADFWNDIEDAIKGT